MLFLWLLCSNYWTTGVFLATRTPFMCGAVHLAKHMIKRFLLRPHRQGRHKKLVRALTVVLDQLLPTAFYGECAPPTVLQQRSAARSFERDT
jgi:hypothetical protein